MELTKHKTIILLVLFVSLILYLVLGYSSFCAMFLISPISLCVDLCYITLPITLLAMLGLSIYSHIKKDFVKFNKIYEILAFMIAIGYMDACFEISIMSVYGSYYFDKLKIFMYILFLIFLIVNIIFIARKKDTRMFTYGFLPIFLLLVLYRYVELVGY